jgi:cell division protein FtsL
MIRLSAILLVLVVVSALSVVSFTHRSRGLVKAQEREQSRSRALEAEWTQLQLENSTWAAPARVEKIARERLAMSQPARDRLLSLEASTGGAR